MAMAAVAMEWERIEVEEEVKTTLATRGVCAAGPYLYGGLRQTAPPTQNWDGDEVPHGSLIHISSSSSSETKAEVVWEEGNKEGGPHPRAEAHLAVLTHPSPPHSQRVILFGGTYFDDDLDDDVWFNDSWAFNPATRTWKLLSMLGQPPHARSEGVMVALPASANMQAKIPPHLLQDSDLQVLFGGACVMLFGGTCKHAEPDARYYRDVRIGFMVGSSLQRDDDDDDGNDKDDDKGEPDGMLWVKCVTGGDRPPTLRGATGVYDAANEALVIVSGRHQTPFYDVYYSADVYSMDIVSLMWEKRAAIGDVPRARFDMASLYLPGPQRIVAGGGNVLDDDLDDGPVDDLYLLNTNVEPVVWECLASKSPDPTSSSALPGRRFQHSLIAIPNHPNDSADPNPNDPDDPNPNDSVSILYAGGYTNTQPRDLYFPYLARTTITFPDTTTTTTTTT